MSAMSGYLVKNAVVLSDMCMSWQHAIPYHVAGYR